MPTEDPSIAQTPWILQAVTTAFIALALGLITAYFIHRYKQRVITSVEIVVNTGIDPNTTDIVVTNHGRSAIVVTELNIHIPAKDLIPGMPSPIGPKPKKYMLFRIRRKFKTQGSRNDLLEMVAQSYLSEGMATHRVIKGIETITVGPSEKASRRLQGENLPQNTPKLETSNPVTFIPSCKIAEHKKEIWGSPVVIGKATVGEIDWPMVMMMDWK